MKKRVTTTELLHHFDKKLSHVVEHLDQRIDDLARATQMGFQHAEEAHNRLVGHVGTLDRRIDVLTNSVDGFVRLHQTLDTELVAVRGKYDRLEERVEKLEAR